MKMVSVQSPKFIRKLSIRYKARMWSPNKSVEVYNRGVESLLSSTTFPLRVKNQPGKPTQVKS